MQPQNVRFHTNENCKRLEPRTAGIYFTNCLITPSRLFRM